MATYSEYRQQSFITNNDFELYSSFDWNHDQSYIPNTTYPEQTYIPSTTYDTVADQAACAQPFSDGYSLSGPGKHEVHDAAFTYLPTNSTAHSFDYSHQPSVLSAPSDSGASIQSSLSSAIGSPSVNPQQQNQGWHFRQGIALLDRIAQHDIFATSRFEIDPIPIMDKACVASAAQDRPDSDEMSYSWSISMPYDTPTSAVSAASSWTIVASGDEGKHSALSVRTRQHTASPKDSIFKSPNTPASASSLPGSISASPPQSNALQQAAQSRANPSLIQQFSPAQATGTQYTDIPAIHSPQHMTYPSIPKRAPSRSPHLAVGKVSGSSSPYMRTHQWQPYPALPCLRR
ncbi:hypothetical protein B0A48_18521 [Cryoendolithus antarcticus]|uniref:Uncharacterized protein n=1 Tax=Cryoendolithus antarcticus TaxID=1507870 RepID=A0A1V8S902_9PEZI|nr:hypothetical protein B0A48_18521 [Cryoendolithus antarcticus]